MRKISNSGDAGHQILEYVACLLLAAVLVVAVIQIPVLRTVPGEFRAAVCRVLGKSCAPADNRGPTRNDLNDRPPRGGFPPENRRKRETRPDRAGFEPPKDFTPPHCVSRGSSWSVSTDYSVDLILGKGTISGMFGFEKLRLANGKYRIVLTLKSSSGVEVGTDEVLKLNLGMQTTLQDGDTWEFGSEKKADRFVTKLKDYIAAKKAQVAYPVLGELHPGDWGGPPRRPDITTEASSVEGDGEVGGELPVLGEVEGTLEGSVEVQHRVDRRTGVTADRITIAGSYSLEGRVSVYGNTVQTGLSRSLRIYRNKKGEVIRLRFTSNYDLSHEQELELSGSGGMIEASVEKNSTNELSVVRMTELRVDTPAERRIVDSWLNNHPVAFTAEAGFIVPHQSPGPDATPFRRLLYRQATVAQSLYLTSGDGSRVSFGFFIETESSGEDAKTRAISSRKLGKPSNGERSWRRFDRCLA